MLNKLFPVLLLCAALTTAFTTYNPTYTDPSPEKVCSDYLNVTNPSSGTAVMNWHFDNATGGTTYDVVVKDQDSGALIASFSTASTSATIQNIPTGHTYTFKVSRTDAQETVIIGDIVFS